MPDSQPHFEIYKHRMYITILKYLMIIYCLSYKQYLRSLLYSIDKIILIDICFLSLVIETVKCISIRPDT